VRSKRRALPSSSSAPIMRVSAVSEVVRWLTRNGRSVDPLLQASGLAPFDLTEPNNVIPLIPASEFVKLVQESEGPDIGCRVVTSATLSRIGGMGQVLLRGPTIRASVLNLAVAFSNQATHAHLTVTPERDCIVIRHFYALQMSEDFLHFSQQFSAALLRSLCERTGAPEPWIERVEIVPHPEYGLDHLIPYFGASLCPSTSGGLLARVPRHVADRPFGPEVSEQSNTDSNWQSLRGTGTLADSVGLILRELLREGEPAVREVASICGLSTRTFQRRLANEGMSFANVLDEVRREVFLGLLDSGKQGINEAGSAAGYSSPSAITRAVRRWTGRPPRHLKRQRIKPASARED